jgi:hypothetical protein
MKNKLITFTVFFLLTSNQLFADVVFFKTPEIFGKISTPAKLSLTDWQTIMSCHFDVNGRRKESVRYLQTILKNTAPNEYSLSIKKGSLSETLPKWKLLTCAYKILLIGKNSELENRSIFGEIYLLGQEHGQMTTDELKDMQNKNFIARILADKTEDIKLLINTEGGIAIE